MGRTLAVCLALLIVLSTAAATGLAQPATDTRGASGGGVAAPTGEVPGTGGVNATNATAGTEDVHAAPTATADPPRLTGFHRPRVDGLLYGERGQTLPEGTAGEWADGFERTVSFGDGEGTTFETDLYVKTVDTGDGSPSTYVAAAMPARHGPLRAVRFDLDRDGDGEPSPGDVRIVATPGDGGAGERYWAPTGIRVYRDGVYLPISDVADVDREALERRIGTVAVASGADLVGEVDEARETTVEAEINTSALDAALGGEGSASSVGVSIDLETEEDRFSIVDEVDAGYDVSGTHLDREDWSSAVTIPKVDLGLDLEVAQALQTEGHGLPLVADKQTLGRAFVTHNRSSSLRVRVTFSAYTAGGSTRLLGTRTVTYEAPPGSPDRTDMDESANLELPAAWTRRPIFLKATVDPLWGIEQPYTGDSLDSEFLGFVPTHDLSVYRVRVNVGTASSPQQASIARRDLVSEGLVDAFPIADARFTDVSWNVVGAQGPNVNRGQLRTDLDSFADQLEMARNLGVPFGTGSLPPFPDQVYGIAQVRGLSDPPWAGGPGDSFAAFGSFFEVTMAHEINHNVGDTPWAFHVNSSTFGCNAPGGDSGWNSRFSDHEIHAIGWNPGDGLVDPRTADIMTYCTPRWMSDYRWTRLHERLRTFDAGEPVHPNLQSVTPELAPSDREVLGETVPTGRVLTGRLFRNGTGSLDPSFEQPGIVEPADGVEDPDALLVIDREDGTTRRIGLTATVADVEGGDLEASTFSVAVRDNGTIQRVALVDAETGAVLDAHERTGWTLQGAALETPGAFERGQRVDVGVSLDADAPGTLHRRLLYSPAPESGLWYPYRPATTEGGFAARFTEYPGGEEARFLLLVSDGLGTRFVTSDPFAVPPRPPEVTIRRNARLEAVRDDGGTHHDPAPIEEIRDASGPVRTTAGGVVSLDARSSDQFGRALEGRETANGAALRWRLAGTDRVLDTGRRFNGTFARPGTYELRVTATDPTSGLTATDAITVEVSAPPLPGREDVDAFLEAVSGDDGNVLRLAPSNRTVATGDRTTYDLEFDAATNGVGLYDIEVNATNVSVANVTGATNLVGGSLESVAIADDGSGVRFKVVGSDTPDAGTVTLARITVTGRAPGTASLTVTARGVGDEGDPPAAYAVNRTENATVRTVARIAAPDVTGDGAPALDVDGNGLFEDVDGNEAFEIFDVAAFLDRFDSPAVQDNVDLFDFDGDGDVDVFDVARLLAEL